MEPIEGFGIIGYVDLILRHSLGLKISSRYIDPVPDRISWRQRILLQFFFIHLCRHSLDQHT